MRAFSLSSMARLGFPHFADEGWFCRGSAARMRVSCPVAQRRGLGVTRRDMALLLDIVIQGFYAASSPHQYRLADGLLDSCRYSECDIGR